MKRILSILLCLCLGAVAFAGCKKSKNPDEVYVYAPDGATAISLAYMYGKKIDDTTVNYKIVMPSAIGGHMANGDADMAVLPTNLGATLYKNGVGLKLAAVITHGNLYVIGMNPIDNLSQLKGKRVGCIGEGLVPDLVFKAILNHPQNEISHRVTDNPNANEIGLKYLENGTNAAGLLIAGQLDYAMFAEPDITRTTTNTDAQIVLDIQEEWKKLMPQSDYDGYPQAGLFVKDGLDSGFVDAFIAKMKDGDGWAEKESNIATALNAIKSVEGANTITELTSAQVKNCNIKTMTEGLQDYIESYFGLLGIPLPASGFYY